MRSRILTYEMLTVFGILSYIMLDKVPNLLYIKCTNIDNTLSSHSSLRLIIREGR